MTTQITISKAEAKVKQQSPRSKSPPVVEVKIPKPDFN